ncbi:methyl-accepting chemotaxis protein [Butyrivibrio hungatei]|uniref:Methyl-accepting chemotaxis protein n=1 Tax=Butyrivibrio hungatei TaxID=185008 RepID=A0A1D9P0G5_9FIRM|nr:methyl-accepting chemotaxis protein [Butyrivibrio hungatei]AOZ96003.1 methyl-accepting chemotaxis protein [Butyrivibrio hungatei]
MKKLSLRVKMLICILPVMAVAMIVLTYVAASLLSDNLQKTNTDSMYQNVNANATAIDTKLEIVRTTATNIAEMVSTSYQFVEIDNYRGTLSKIISDNDSVLGSGVWFEPYVFDSAEKYMGPYWYKDGNTIVETWDYSNAEYDYFNEEYYTSAKNLKKGEASITDPYYDETSGMVMSSCSAPIYDGDKFVGCVTVDMKLEDVQNMVSNIKVGKTGRAILLASDGTYIYTDDLDKVASSMKMQEDPSAAFATVGAEIVEKASDSPAMGAAFEPGGTVLLTYKNVPKVNWKMIVAIDYDEINEPVVMAVRMLVILAIVALLIGAVIIWLFVLNISKSINNVKAFAGVLASGDFTVDKMINKRGDELGQMSESLNNMYESNREVISRISDGSVQVSETSSGLANMANELSDQFGSIRDNMSGVNDAMMASGAATEQVNASVEEVNASVQQLASETESSSSEAADIKERAKEIEKKSHDAYENALNIAEQRQADLEDANEKAKVVDQIGSLADTIAEIADQINLLSLNASIEAARAGDAGKGFAVVASEINKLASGTSEAVEQIRDTIEGVQEAFGTLSGASDELLGFIKETAIPDYDNFVNVAKQYGSDADSFGVSSEKIAGMAENIRSAMDEVSKAIQNIAESTQDTADLSSRVNDSVLAASDVVSNVNDMTTKQEDIANTLGEIVGKFKLK